MMIVKNNLVKTCLVKVSKDEWVKAELIGFFQFSNVLDPSPFIGGHPGGVIAYPVALVKINGEIAEYRASYVKIDG